MEKPFAAQGRELPPHHFEEIYERNVNTLYRVCFSYMKNAADTEDAVADVFVKLLKSGKTFQSIEHEKAWLLRTAINRCKDYLKHWWRKRADIDDYDIAAPGNLPEIDEILESVLELPERYKAVIYLYYYEGYSSAEIASILNKPQSTILNHLSEARKYLKGVLENEE